MKLKDLDKKALAEAVGVWALGLAAIPLIYLLLIKRKEAKKIKKDGKEKPGRTDDEGQSPGKLQ